MGRICPPDLGGEFLILSTLIRHKVEEVNRIAKPKFFIGFLLIILSFILGKVALHALAISYYLSLLIYAISWALLIGGIAMCGKKGWYMAKHLNKKYGNRVIECFKKLKFYC